MNTVSVVVAERGSEWVDWARHMRSATCSTIVIAQNLDEGDAAFAERVQDRLGRLRGKGTRVEQAVFVSGSGSQPHRHGLQARLLRRLSSLLSGTAGRSRLYLDATAAAPPVRRMMDALAWTLSELAEGSGLSISVDGAPRTALPGLA